MNPNSEAPNSHKYKRHATSLTRSTLSNDLIVTPPEIVSPLEPANRLYRPSLSYMNCLPAISRQSKPPPPDTHSTTHINHHRYYSQSPQMSLSITAPPLTSCLNSTSTPTPFHRMSIKSITHYIHNSRRQCIGATNLQTVIRMISDHEWWAAILNLSLL